LILYYSLQIIKKIRIYQWLTKLLSLRLANCKTHLAVVPLQVILTSRANCPSVSGSTQSWHKSKGKVTWPDL